MNRHYDIFYGSKFKRDLKLAKKRGMDMSKIKAIIDMLKEGIVLPPENRDHNLVGNWAQYRECHITPDWLLIYKKEEKISLITLYRTGTHSELLEK